MLLTLLAVLSSTVLLVSAVSTAGALHAGVQIYVPVILLALVLAAANFCVVRAAGLLLANAMSSKSAVAQSWFGRVFCFTVALWSVGMAFVGSWCARLPFDRWIGNS